jgi:hypothetical protein
LSQEQRARLEVLTRSYTSPYRDVIRAKIALYAADGLHNDQIAARLDTAPDKSSASGENASSKRASQAWRSGLDAGDQPAFPPRTVIAVKALACGLPSTLGLPLSRFTILEIRREVLQRGLVASIGDTTIWRWLTEDAIRPWAHRTWIFRHRRPHPGARQLAQLNQVEIYFSVVQRKALTPNDFGFLAELENHLLGFQERYQLSARPFEWKFTRCALRKLLAQLHSHCLPRVA